jgi:hypothetical protein
MIRVFVRFFQDLFAGDPVALTVGGVLLTVVILGCLFWWKIARDLRREDEQRKQRWKKK